MEAKKILAGACATFMLAMTAAPVVSAADAVKVTIGNTTAEAGGKFSVTVDLADIPTAGINGCDFGIEFDSSALTVTAVNAGALAKEDSAALEGVNTLETNIESGLVSVIYGLGTTDTSNYMTGSGTFLTLEGTVSNSVAAGKYDLKIVAVDRLADPNGTADNTDIIFGNLSADGTATVYTPTITNGYVEVLGDTTQETTEAPTVEPTVGPTIEIGEASLLGDVDCSGSVELGDSVALAKYVASPILNPLSEQGMANADVTQDKVINSADASMLVEFNVKSITSFV